jgi:hypothetical protein
MYKIIISYQSGGLEEHDVKTEQEARDAVESWRRKDMYIAVGNQLIDRDLLENVTSELSKS